jgi:hypothetical protein
MNLKVPGVQKRREVRTWPQRNKHNHTRAGLYISSTITERKEKKNKKEDTNSVSCQIDRYEVHAVSQPIYVRTVVLTVRVGFDPLGAVVVEVTQRVLKALVDLFLV